MRVTTCHELYVCAPNQVGVGATIFADLVGVGANVVAFSAWEREGHACFVIVLDEQVEQAKKVLIKRNFEIDHQKAISVDLTNRPGSLVALLRTLADANIDVVRSYATGTGTTHTRVVLQTADNEMARHVISTIPGRA